ncbi:MAG: polyprenyl synthetase family protein [Alphaproteobacteria bacterium]|nr:polyprenyl synthetase family protein [Alphaproteobacteria bacterium]
MNYPHDIPAAYDDTPLDRISRQLIADDLDQFRQEINNALAPQAEYLTPLEHQLYAGGKKIRPAMMFLSARMICGDAPVSAKAVKGAASLEILHVATLIHDDIVDDAMIRRGLPSISAERGYKKALLVGDLQFVQAIRGFVDAIDTESDMALVRLVLDTAFNICRGELDELNIEFSDDYGEMRNQYFKMIDRKTAVLFGLACEAGVSLAGGRTHEARRAGFFGRRFGHAFQIVDDLLDIVRNETSAGKTPGTDLMQHRWSLPLIYAAEEFGQDHPIFRSLVKGEPLGEIEFRRSLTDLKQSKAFDRAYADARTAALESLFYLQHFPESTYRDALEELAMHIVDQHIESSTQSHIKIQTPASNEMKGRPR